MKKMFVSMSVDVPDHFSEDMVKGLIEVLATNPNMFATVIRIEEYIPYEFTKQ